MQEKLLKLVGKTVAVEYAGSIYSTNVVGILHYLTNDVLHIHANARCKISPKQLRYIDFITANVKEIVVAATDNMFYIKY